MEEIKKLYRYEVSRYDVEDNLRLISFDVIKETDKGYWIESGIFPKKWVKKGGRKKYAYETPKLALYNFIKRYEKYIDILETKINPAKRHLKIAYDLISTDLSEDKNNTELPKYLVCPNNYKIFTLNPENNEYYSELIGANRNQLQSYSYDTLVNIHHFYPAKECELEMYKKKSDEYYEFVNWQSRHDGHGGSKGGTYEQFLRHKKDVKKYNKFNQYHDNY